MAGTAILRVPIVARCKASCLRCATGSADIAISWRFASQRSVGKDVSIGVQVPMAASSFSESFKSGVQVSRLTPTNATMCRFSFSRVVSSIASMRASSKKLRISAAW